MVDKIKMSKKLIDMLSDESEMERRVGCMRGVGHIFERQSRPSLQQRIFRRRTNFSNNTNDEYYHVSSDDIQPIAQRKGSLPIKKLYRTASFDASNPPSASLLCQGFPSPMQHSFESEEILQPSVLAGSPLYFHNSPTSYPQKGQKAVNHNKISRFEFDEEVINRFLGEESKESSSYKGRQTHYPDFREVGEGAFAPFDDQSTKTSDEGRNSSSQTFDSDGFQKHIQESNDLVSSWLGCRERAIDDLKESLRLLGKLKDQEFNNVNSKLTSQHPLDFKKASQHTQRGASRHAIEECLQEISHADSKALIKIGKKAKESSRRVQGTREGNGSSVDSKGLGSEFQDEKAPPRIVLEGRKSIRHIPRPEISAKTGLYNREISGIFPERTDDPKGKYDSCSRGHNRAMVSEIVINAEKHKRAPNVIARLMGLDAMHETKGFALPESEKRPTSNAAPQQEALYNKPQKETSKKQVVDKILSPKREKDVQNLNSQPKNECSNGETLERSKGFQSVEDGKTQNKAFLKPQSMETTTHLEMLNGQRHTEDASYVTCKQQEDTLKSVAAPRYKTDSTIKFSQKTNDLGSATLQKTSHENRQFEAHVDHQKLQNQNSVSIMRPGLDDEMETRFRQLRLQNALDEHKTLREILETMQLKGLLQSPQSKRIQEIQHQKSIDDVPQTKPEHENVGSKIKDFRSKDLSADKQENPTNMGHKRHRISSTESLSETSYDKRNYKEAAIVVIKPILGLEASKFIAPSHDPSEMQNSRSRVIAASFKAGTEQGQILESKKNSKKKVNGNCETNGKISKSRKISLLFVNAEDSQTTENEGLQIQDSELLEKSEELSPAPPIFQLLASVPKPQFLGKDQNIGGTDSGDLVRNFKSADNVSSEAMQNSQSLGKAYHKFSGKNVVGDLEERFLRETNLQHEGVTPCDIRLPIISLDVKSPSFEETTLIDPSALLGKGDRHQETLRETHPEREQKHSGDPRELSNSQKMDVLRLFLSDLSEISNKPEEFNVVNQGIDDNVQTKLMEAKVTTSEMQNEIIKSSKAMQDELESESNKDKERTLGRHIYATNSSDKRLILNIEEDPAKDLPDEHATKWQPAEGFPTDAGRPSPISVLDIRFQKDEHVHTNTSSSTKSTKQSPLTSSSCKRSLDSIVDKVLQEVEPLQDLTGIVYATFQTDVPHYPKGADKKDQSQESLSVTDSGRFQWQDDRIASIKDILEISGFAEMSPLLTQCQPLNPPIEHRQQQSMNKVTIRNYLKKDEASKIDEMEKKATEIADRRLHFECVNEIIAKNLIPFVNLHPWLSFSQPILQKRPPGDELVQQAWKELRELPCLPIEDACDMLHILLEQDLTQTPPRWSGLKAEIVEVGLHLANLIFEDAVVDMIYDFVVLATARKLS
ncbi:hypothetical protein O6H91_Y347100 [Diphasiastrum complanatum]|nr:hypothetical protein O6H91_Y347100 [Diphasiastrum complanatum]